MTATLTNVGPHTIHNVTVKTVVLAGESRIWMQRFTFGTLEAGESITVTTQIDVGLFEGLAIKSNNGYVTIKTVITTPDSRRVITVRRDVT